jgi:hypothetical protein
MFRAAVQAGQALARLEVDVPAELRRDGHLVTERCDALAQDALDFMRTVGFGRIEECDATVERGAQDLVHLRAGRNNGLIRAAHVLRAQADARYFQLTQLAAARHDRSGPVSRLSFAHQWYGGRARCSRNEAAPGGWCVGHCISP